MSTTRREFLVHTSTAALLAAAACKSTDTAAKPPAPEAHAKGVLFKLSLAQWSLHQALQKKELDPLDFPRVARSEYGIDTVEYVNTFYKEHKGDDAHWKQLARRCADHGVTSRLIMIDAEGSLGAANESERKQAVAKHRRWLEIASQLRCKAIRVNAYGEGSPEEQRRRAAASLYALGELGATFGLYVIVENHGGLSSNGAWMAELMRAAAHPRVGTLPDFGNFTLAEGQLYDRYTGVREMMPWARAVSAKSYDFDARGEETTIDYRRMLKLVLTAGYHEHLGIEYEGTRLSEHDGILATKKLLETIRAELS